MPTVLPEVMNVAACSALMTLARNSLQLIRMSASAPGQTFVAPHTRSRRERHLIEVNSARFLYRNDHDFEQSTDRFSAVITNKFPTIPTGRAPGADIPSGISGHPHPSWQPFAKSLGKGITR